MAYANTTATRLVLAVECGQARARTTREAAAHLAQVTGKQYNWKEII